MFVYDTCMYWFCNIIYLSSLQESSEEDLTVHGSDSSDESEDELDDSASLASSVADISSGRSAR